MLAAQSLAVGSNEVMVAGGMESMSNVPYYLSRSALSLSLPLPLSLSSLVQCISPMHTERGLGLAMVIRL